MVHIRQALTGLALVAVVSGCGGEREAASSGLSDDEQKAADNLAVQIVRSGSVSGGDSGGNSGGDSAGDPDAAVTEDQATCVAEGAVSEVGLESLQGYGILTDDLRVDKSIQGVEMSEGDADALAAVFVECIDAEALFEQRFLRMVPEPSEDVRGCVEDAVEEEAVREILAASFRGTSTEAFGELQRSVAACSR